jgi:hypothetical protein
MWCSRRVAMSALLFHALLTSCAVRTETSLMGEPSRLTLGQARDLLEQSTNPVDRARAYVQVSDILIRYVHSDIPRNDADATREWLDQYQDAILSARQTMLASGRDAQRHPEGYRELEISLRRHIRWLSDWRIGLVDEERAPFDDTVRTATAVRGEMLQLLFPVFTAGGR